MGRIIRISISVVLIIGLIFLLSPALRWNTFVPQEIKDIVTANQAELENFAIADAQEAVEFLNQRAREGNTEPLPDEYEYLIDAAEDIVPRSERPERWTAQDVLDAFGTSGNALISFQEEVTEELEDLQRQMRRDPEKWIDVGGGFEIIVTWLRGSFKWLFDFISTVITGTLDVVEAILTFPPAIIIIALFAVLAFFTNGIGMGLFTILGFGLITVMGLWTETMSTLSLVLTSVLISLVLGVPIGIWSSKDDRVWQIIRPTLDFMQTLPAFVYLIPAVLFFRLGAVPGVVATLVFSLPPAVRLTNLGIRQVPKEIKEAAISYGSTNKQMLFKAELPVALPTIMAGINQTIMLALSMVVIAGLIGAGGLGNVVNRGLQQLNIGDGFEGGIAIVILAIFLDRVTQSLGSGKKKKKHIEA